MFSIISKTAILTMIFLALTACNSATSIDTEILASKLERNLTPDASPEQIKRLASNNNQFSFEMFAELQKTYTDNLFFSPYSISEALVMTYVGAKEQTKSEMANVLHFEKDDARLHESFNALDLHLNFDDGNYTFRVANALWPQKEYHFLEHYLDTIMVNYGASLRVMDYINHTEASRQIINAWVEEKTNEKIKELIKKGMLDDRTRLVITNAVYFKAKWSKEFSEHATKEEDFRLKNHSIVKTSMMHQNEQFRYSESDTYQAVELPYVTGKSSMIVVLPKEGQFDEVAANIDVIYGKIADMPLYAYLDLKLPMFEFTTQNYQLKEMFKALGMLSAFENADFSGMTGKKDLQIDDIIHKAFIKVDEEGSEAAAATAVIIGITGVLEPLADPIKFHANRPFLFFIKDNLSNQILFMGSLTNPKS